MRVLHQGLLAQAETLDDYITDSLGEREPMEVLTLFSLIGGTTPYQAVTCCELLIES